MSSSIVFHSWMNENIQSPRIDIVLLTLGGGSAMLDIMTTTLLKISTSHATMNLLVLGAGTTGLQNEFPLLIHPSRAGVAIVSFWLGAFTTGRMSRLLGPTKRKYLFLELGFQSILVYVVAVLVYSNTLSFYNNSNHIIILILALAFGAQFATLKLLATCGCKVIPGQVITGAGVDLFTDKDLFKLNNKNRNHRILFLVVFFGGGALGALLVVRGADPSVVLFIVASFKLIAALTLLFLNGETSLPIVLESVIVISHPVVAEEQEKGEEKEKEVKKEEEKFDCDSIDEASICSKYQVRVSIV